MRLIAAATLLSLVALSHANACVAPLDIEQSILSDFEVIVAETDAIFLGEIVDVALRGDDLVQVTVEVQTEWKGDVEDVVVVLEPNLGLTCITGMSKGASYVFFANSAPDGELSLVPWHRERPEHVPALMRELNREFQVAHVD